ncbi:hypothetical protein EJ05DRAFT_42445 [Pseudovirgaria hyperparasitica]|uniref:Uncharacterized protein n=1 Tax=Pseudovirgaria hyperparasitica TaxID=470096 RepID=A0A6A6WN25_9PEZI|nr:uncharacterized protein EJ05DRAFT_42445 [Pseudovirgaria hyperparasitica]KAF2763533.1 hypothetical protein EJ05DRAFT_42445 [Pseudovirgaria hyperparasitica]
MEAQLRYEQAKYLKQKIKPSIWLEKERAVQTRQFESVKASVQHQLEQEAGQLRKEQEQSGVTRYQIDLDNAAVDQQVVQNKPTVVTAADAARVAQKAEQTAKQVSEIGPKEERKRLEEAAAEEEKNRLELTPAKAQGDYILSLEHEIKVIDEKLKKDQKSLEVITGLLSQHEGETRKLFQTTVESLEAKLVHFTAQREVKMSDLAAVKKNNHVEKQSIVRDAPNGASGQCGMSQMPQKPQETEMHRNTPIIKQKKQSLEHQQRFPAWPTQRLRDNGPQIRRVKLTNLSIKYTPNKVVCLVWAGRVERIEHHLGSNQAMIQFLCAKDCRAYHEATANGIVVPGEDRVVDVELDQAPTSTNDYTQQLIKHDVSEL